MRKTAVALLASLSLTACSTLNIDGVSKRIEESRPDISSSEFSKAYQAQFDRYVEIYSVVHGRPTELKSTLTQAQFTEYTSAGFNYVDRKCREYFYVLNSFYKKKRESVNTTSIVTALLSGVLSAAKAKASEIAVVAIGGSGTAALIDNDGSSFLFDLDPASTEGLVKRAGAAYRASVSQQSILTFGDAVTAVQGYAGICLPANIERLVKEAVNTANPVDAASVQTNLYRLTSSKARDLLSDALGLQVSLDDNEIGLLLWLTELAGGADNKSIASIKSRLPSTVVTKLFKPNKDEVVDDAIGKDLVRKVGGILRTFEATDPNLRARAQSLKNEFQSSSKVDSKPADTSKAPDTTKPAATNPPDETKPVGAAKSSDSIKGPDTAKSMDDTKAVDSSKAELEAQSERLPKLGSEPNVRKSPGFVPPFISVPQQR